MGRGDRRSSLKMKRKKGRVKKKDRLKRRAIELRAERKKSIRRR